MKSMIDQAFRRYGMTVTVEHGAETGETHGFVQPVTAVSGGEPFSVGPLGAADRRCWRYLGSAEVSVAQGDSRFSTKPETAGERENQWSSSSVAPSTPPSVMPETEWTW